MPSPRAGPASEELRAIQVDPIPERIGQRLADRAAQLAQPDRRADPAALSAAHDARHVSRAISASSRKVWRRSASSTSTRPTPDRHQEPAAALLVNTVHVANSFDLNPNQYSTVVGEDDAAVRSVAELDQEIVTRLTLFMQRRLAEQPPAPS